MKLKRNIFLDTVLAVVTILVMVNVGYFIIDEKVVKPHILPLIDKLLGGNMGLDFIIGLPLILLLFFSPALLSFIIYLRYSKNVFASIFIGIITAIGQFILMTINLRFP